jgi:hypothetical protein
MLLYLSHDIFWNEASGPKTALCNELSTMLAMGYPVILVHPTLEVPFYHLIDTCPRDLHEQGLFKPLAVPWNTCRAYEVVSANMLAEFLLGGKSYPCSWTAPQVAQTLSEHSLPENPDRALVLRESVDIETELDAAESKLPIHRRLAQPLMRLFGVWGRQRVSERQPPRRLPSSNAVTERQPPKRLPTSNAVTGSGGDSA